MIMMIQCKYKVNKIKGWIMFTCLFVNWISKKSTVIIPRIKERGLNSTKKILSLWVNKPYDSARMRRQKMANWYVQHMNGLIGCLKYKEFI